MGFNAARSIFANAFDPRRPAGKTPASDAGNSEWLYLGGAYAEILDFLCSPVNGPANVKLLVSEPGLGKTVLLRSAIERMKAEARTAFVYWTLFNPEDFVEHLLSELGSSEPPPPDLNAAQVQFENLLQSAKAEGRRLVLAIDDAHNLSPATLQNLSALLDRDTALPPQLTVLLAGLPGLHELIADPAGSGIKKRIAGVRTLELLNAEQTAEYIRARTAALGIDRVTAENSAKIAAGSGGVLRSIDRLCHELQPRDEGWQQRIISVLRADPTDTPLLDAPLNGRPVTEMDAPVNGKPITQIGAQVNGATAARAADVNGRPVAPLDLRVSEESIPIEAHVARLAAWAAQRPAMWSGTMGELASASGISVEEVSDAIENRAEELRRSGIAAAVQRSPGRPRMITLSRLEPEATLQPSPKPEPGPAIASEATIESQPTIPDDAAAPQPYGPILERLKTGGSSIFDLPLPTGKADSSPLEYSAKTRPEHEVAEWEQEAVFYPEAGLGQQPGSETGLHWTHAAEGPDSPWALTPAVIFAIIFGVIVMLAGAIVYLRSANSPHKASSTTRPVSATRQSPEADEVTGLLTDRQRLASYEQAAKQGDSVAQRRLGLALSLRGDGGAADRVAAYTWLVMARNGGQAVDKTTLDSLTRSLSTGEIRDIRYRLGRMYERGIGSPANPVFADEWFLLGAAVNDPRSRAESAALERRMSRQQISQAHVLSNDWLRRHAE